VLAPMEPVAPRSTTRRLGFFITAEEILSPADQGATQPAQPRVARAVWRWRFIIL
jgi:hypothetical protein